MNRPRRRKVEPTIIFVETTLEQVRAKHAPKPFKPLPTRDTQALVIASMLLSTPLSEDSDPMPEALTEWARKIVGEVTDA